jgi:hypothetical protein
VPDNNEFLLFLSDNNVDGVLICQVQAPDDVLPIRNQQGRIPLYHGKGN